MLRLATDPSRYRHWKLVVAGHTARLTMAVREEEPFRAGYQLKLNSYDLGVDLELADAVNRLRFEHPEVDVVIVDSDKDRVFCAGANIHMLAQSTHAFKVNFCKFTNETRLALEETSRESGIKWLAALGGTCAGGGYELALACDEAILVDDGSSAVSLPEVPLLGVLPGTGGLTRLVDKRKVRRDHADVFCTVAEGIRGKRAVEWRLVDAIVPKSRFAQAIEERAAKLAAAGQASGVPRGAGVVLSDVVPAVEGDTWSYDHVTLVVDRPHRTARLTMHAPKEPVPEDVASIRAQGSGFWPLKAFRELDDALLRLRLELDEVGVVLLETRGDPAYLASADRAVAHNQDDRFVREVRLLMARVLRRLDATSRTFFAIVDEQSCFHGVLLELALMADRTYMLDDPDGKVTVQAGPLSAGLLPTGQGPSRLAIRMHGTPGRLDEVLARLTEAPVGAADASAVGVATVVADDIDFADEVRVAVEERVSLSPDALTGMEQNLRGVGAETLETKIFGRLSAWQNWIFTRPNATGERGALTLYGKPERPVFDARRT
jgi:benzoyl-CoA-dihydrodiol lyase